MHTGVYRDFSLDIVYIVKKPALYFASWVGILLFAVFIFVPKASGATMGNVSDRISTSRPSASSVLFVDQAAATSSAVIIDNSSIFLASDSATFRPDTGETLNTNTVASFSASFSSSPTKRVVHFTSTISNTHHRGDPVVVPITALHTITFTNINPIPVNGEIELAFPALTSGDANNAASPSATTFQLNNIGSSQIEVWDDGSEITSNVTVTTTNPASGTSPFIRLTALSAEIAANSVVRIFLGCSASSSSACTTAVPRIINPTKTAAPGVADQSTSGWTLNITTRDISNNLTLDTGRAKIGTVEAVQVSATVDPSLTFTISGLAAATNYNSEASDCGSNTSTTGSTATVVDLGTLSSSAVNNAGQVISVTTNLSTGYTITATSSGKFMDNATGFNLPDANTGGGLTANDTPAPTSIAAGTAEFGISPCGARVPSSSPNWGGSGSTVSTGNFSNPWNTGVNSYYATIASYAGAATGGVSADKTVIRYAATVAATTPAGVYTNFFTYVVTPTF